MNLQYLLPHQLKQALDNGWPLLVPTGCIEYHGPHLALGLDTLLAEMQRPKRPSPQDVTIQGLF